MPRSIGARPAGDQGTDAQALAPAQSDRLLAVFRGLGARHVRFTGGEPLLSASLNGRIAHARALGFARVSLTTNGHLLSRKAAGLAAAGLHDVNVSLDSLDPARFARITGGGDLRRVLAGLDAARRVLGEEALEDRFHGLWGVGTTLAGRDDGVVNVAVDELEGLRPLEGGVARH